MYLSTKYASAASSSLAASAQRSITLGGDQVHITAGSKDAGQQRHDCGTDSTTNLPWDSLPLPPLTTPPLDVLRCTDVPLSTCARAEAEAGQVLHVAPRAAAAQCPEQQQQQQQQQQHVQKLGEKQEAEQEEKKQVQQQLLLQQKQQLLEQKQQLREERLARFGTGDDAPHSEQVMPVGSSMDARDAYQLPHRALRLRWPHPALLQLLTQQAVCASDPGWPLLLPAPVTQQQQQQYPCTRQQQQQQYPCTQQQQPPSCPAAALLGGQQHHQQRPGSSSQQGRSCSIRSSSGAAGGAHVLGAPDAAGVELQVALRHAAANTLAAAAAAAAAAAEEESGGSGGGGGGDGGGGSCRGISSSSPTPVAAHTASMADEQQQHQQHRQQHLLRLWSPPLLVGHIHAVSDTRCMTQYYCLPAFL
jgi:hypothetical protein